MKIQYSSHDKVNPFELFDLSAFANTGAVEFYQNSMFSICPNGMVLTDCPERQGFENNFQEKWIKRHKKATYAQPNNH